MQGGKIKQTNNNSYKNSLHEIISWEEARCKYNHNFELVPAPCKKNMCF